MDVALTLGSTELLRLKYSSEENAWLCDGRKIALEDSDIPEVHAFVDGSIVEMMLSGRVGYTKRFYYPGAIAPDITIRTNGLESTLKAWAIKPISHDRLTTMNTFA